jgi:HNH/endonuclease VII toxin of polymorphic toxin system
MSMHNGASFPRNTAPWPYLSEMQMGSGGPCEGVDIKFRLTSYGQGCTDGKTPHHIIPDRTMQGASGPRFSKYTHGSAPCICVDGTNQHQLEHAACHAIFDPVELQAYAEMQEGSRTAFTYAEAREAGIASARGANGGTALDTQTEECLRAQLENHFKDRCGATDYSPLRASGKRGKHIEAPAPSSPSVDI